MTDVEDDQAVQSIRRKRWPLLAFLPLAVFAAIAVLFRERLHFGGDPSHVPSALIGRPAPAFNLAPVDGLANRPGLADSDLRQGRVTVVNIFASWCAPCHREHPVLTAIAKDPDLASEGISLVGIAYKDNPADTRSFLNQAGDPYAKIGADRSGLTGIDFGISGVPETFVVKGDGTIAYKFIGPMTADDWRDTVLPQVEKARR